VTVRQSHGGSGKQAVVIDGLEADVVTLALAYDIDELAEKADLSRLIGRSAAKGSSPYTRRSSFCTQGQSKGIRDWTTCETGVSVITPNPRLPAARAGTTSRPGACAQEARIGCQGA